MGTDSSAGKRADGAAPVSVSVGGAMMSIDPLREGECHVFAADASKANPDLVELLDDGERQRWDNFRVATAKTLYLAAHALVRVVLAELVDTDPTDLRFGTTCQHCGKPHGKPYLLDSPAPIELSLSHSGDRVVVAIAHAVPIGVDVEQIGRHNPDLPAATLSEPELAELHRMPTEDQPAGFIRYWARKEALLKATGHGLAVPPSEVTVSAPDADPALLAWEAKATPPAEAYLADLNCPPDYRASLAMLGGRPAIAEHDANDLLALGPP